MNYTGKTERIMVEKQYKRFVEAILHEHRFDAVYTCRRFRNQIYDVYIITSPYAEKFCKKIDNMLLTLKSSIF